MGSSKSYQGPRLPSQRVWIFGPEAALQALARRMPEDPTLNRLLSHLDLPGHAKALPRRDRSLCQNGTDLRTYRSE